MYYNIILLLLMTELLDAFTVGQHTVQFFRDDYHFLEKTQSFYKIHKTALEWPKAMSTCRSENAELFYARNKDEFDAVSEYRKTLGEQVKSDAVVIGITASFIPGLFDTIDGIPLMNVYNNWAQNEPNNLYGKENVIEMNIATGTMNDIPRNDKRLFICKRTLASLSWNNCCNPLSYDEGAVSDNTKAVLIPTESATNNVSSYRCCQEGYTYNEANGRCYKFVFTPKSWTQAYEYCRTEKSYLAIIDNPSEVSFLTALVKNAPKERIRDIYTPGSVHLGFYRNSNEGWLTLKGKSLETSGYTQFAYDSKPCDENLHCGAMFYNGELRDISCNEKCFFICEHAL